MNFKYEKFEDWFNEIEGFGMRSERFNLIPNNYRNNEDWLRAAFDAARAKKENKE